MFQRSLNLRWPSWRCHGDGWRQTVAAILGYEVTCTRDVTFVRWGYPISSIPKTLSRQNLLLTTQYINCLSSFVYHETITLTDKVTPVLVVEVRLLQIYVEAA
jgi:hypothetical protein